MYLCSRSVIFQPVDSNQPILKIKMSDRLQVQYKNNICLPSIYNNQQDMIYKSIPVDSKSRQSLVLSSNIIYLARRDVISAYDAQENTGQITFLVEYSNGLVSLLNNLQRLLQSDDPSDYVQILVKNRLQEYIDGNNMPCRMIRVDGDNECVVSVDT